MSDENTTLDLDAIEAAARAPMTFERPKIHCTHDEERGHAPWCFACDVADRASRPVPFEQRGRGDVIRLVAEVRRLRADNASLDDVARGAFDDLARVRAELEDVRTEAVESERRLNAEISAMDARDETYRALRGADDGSDDLVALAEWRMADLADTRAALRANLRCDECEELATRTHAATASFCCDAHATGEGWSDTTHAAAVRAAVLR
jgi:hypothetical protein